MARHLIASLAEAARLSGTTPPTIRRWVTIGLLPPAPWTPRQVMKAAEKAALHTPRRGQGSAAAHGTASRWRSGCRCDECRCASNEAMARLRDMARRAAFATLGPRLIDLIGSGVPFGQAVREAGTTAQAVTAYRRRDAGFAAELDEVLMGTRDPDAAHGTPSGWRSGCRCPECRDHHHGSAH